MPGREEGLGTGAALIRSHYATFLSDSERPKDRRARRYVPKRISRVNYLEHSGGGNFLWSNVRLVQTEWSALYGSEVLGQPVSNDLGHADEIPTLRELMVGARHHLQMLLDS